MQNELRQKLYSMTLLHVKVEVGIFRIPITCMCFVVIL